MTTEKKASDSHIKGGQIDLSLKLKSFWALCKQETVAILLASIGLVIFLVVAWSPFDWLIRNVLPDDAFYYLTIARNVVQGHGVSFDGLEPTNGFHPLWLVAILPLTALFGDPLAHVRSVLTLGAVLNATSILVLSAIGKEMKVDRLILVPILLLYMLNSYVVVGSNNGMESALSVLSVLGLLLAFLRIVNNEARRVGISGGLWFGTLSAIALLSRLDNVFLVLTMYVFLLLFRRQHTREVLVAGILAGLFMVPYFSWSFLVFGELIPVSGQSIPFLVKTHYLITNGPNEVVDYLVRGFVRNAIQTLTYQGVPLLVLTGSVILCISYSLAHRTRRAWLLSNVVQLSPLWIGSLGFIVFHSFVRWHFRDWYVYSVLPIYFVLLMVALSPVGNRLKSSRYSLLGLVLGAMMAFAVNGYSYLPDASGKYRYGWQESMYQTAEWLNDVLPPGSSIAAYNAGILGYFYHGTVINLDGVVNNRAYPYIRERRLIDYIVESPASYLVDFGDVKGGGHLFLGEGYEERLLPYSRESNDGRNLNFPVEIYAIAR